MTFRVKLSRYLFAQEEKQKQTTPPALQARFIPQNLRVEEVPEEEEVVIPNIEAEEIELEERDVDTHEEDEYNDLFSFTLKMSEELKNLTADLNFEEPPILKTKMLEIAKGPTELTRGFQLALPSNRIGIYQYPLELQQWTRSSKGFKIQCTLQ